MANRIRGITVEINGDTTNLQKSLSGVDKSIGKTQSQLRDVEKLLKLDPTNTELLSQKQRLLGEAVKDTKERLESLKTASEEAAKTKDNYDAWKAKYDPIKKEIGETSKELIKLKEQSEKADEQLSKGEISQEEYDKLQNKVKETSDKLKDLRKDAEKVSEEFGHPISQEQYDAIQREIIDTEHELQNLQREAANSRESLVKIGKAGEGLQNVGGKISGAGEALMPVTAGIVGLGTLAVKTGAEFDTAMSQVSAVSGATGEDLDALRAKAREMGSETKFSASEAAEAMNYMAMAGWKTEDMLNGVEGIMNLAAASGEELGTTSDIVTDALTALGYQAQDAGHFADVLAAASSNANTNVSMLGESFQYVAPVAGSMGASAEDLAIALGLMANSGIKASQAGNSLKNGLVNLVKPTDAQKAAMESLGLMTTETARIIDQAEVDKAQAKVEKETRDLEKAQNNYNAALEKYGEDSYQAKNKLLDLQGAESKLTEAQDALTNAQQGTLEVVGTGQSAFVDEYGNMKSLGEIMDVLRSSLGAVNVELTDSDGNLREYDDIIAELSQTEEGLTQAEQLKNAAILFGKQNLSGMLAIVNASEEDYEKLTNAIYNCDGTAQGMAETMQDNLEGQLTILMSQLQELAISFAEILMPAIRNIVTKIQELVDKFNALSPAQKETIAKIALVAAAIGPLLIVVGKLTTGIGGMMIVFSKMPEIMTKVKGGFTAVKTAIMGISAPVVAIAAVIAILVAAFKHLWETNEDFRNNIIAIWEQIKTTFEALTSGITDRLNTLGFDFNSFTDSLKYAWDWFCNYLAPIFETTFQYIADILGNAVDVILGIVDFFIGLFTGNWEQCWTGIKEFFGGIWDAISNTIGTVFELILNIFNVDFDKFLSCWTTGWNSIKDFFSNIWNSIKNFFSDAGESIKNTGSKIKENIENSFNNAVNFVKNLASEAGSWGKDIINGIVSGIKSKIEDVTDAVKGVADKIRSFLHFSVPDERPLTDFESWMPDFMQGLADGITANADVVQSTISGFATNIATTIKSTIETSLNSIVATVGMLMPQVFTNIQTVWNNSKDTINTVMNTISKGVTIGWNTVINTTKTFLNTMKNNISADCNIIKSIIIAVINSVQSFTSNAWNKISTGIKGVLNGIKSNVSTIWNSMPNSVRTAMNTIQNCVLRVWDKVHSGVWDRIWRIRNTIADGLNSSADCIRNLVNQAWDWGYDLMQNLINGINYQMGSLGNIVSDVANMIWEYLHFSVPEKGPLTDFESWMPDFMQGLAKGIESSQKAVEKTVSGVATAMQLTLGSGFNFDLNGISGAFTGNAGTVNNYYQTDNSRTVNQTNNSPKSLSRLEIYRQTRNALGV